MQNHIGAARLHLRQTDLAATAFRKALTIDPEDVQAQTGLASCFLRLRKYEEAAEAGLSALASRYDFPLAHYCLGIALAHLGEKERAIQAFENVLRIQPAWMPAHRYLALFRAQRGEMEKARWHRAQLQGARGRRAQALAFKATLRNAAADRARTRATKRERTRAQTLTAPAPHQRQSSLEPQEFLIVSGLPRSGTSLMMQILEAAGLTIMRDDSRPADEGNPRGYSEWREIKQLPKNPFLIEQAAGRVTKVISMLLPSLPRKHRFRVIFMKRAIEDVAASQAALRRRLSGATATNAESMQQRLGEHRERMLALLRASSNVELLEIEYTDLLAQPNECLMRIISFAGIEPDRLPKMRAAIAPELRHFGIR